MSNSEYRDHLSMQIDSESKRMLFDFMQEAKFPPKLRSRYFDARELYTNEAMLGAFRQAFPGFPFLFDIYPPNKAREIGKCTDLEGKRGGLLQKHYHAMVASHAASGGVLCVLLLRFAGLRGVRVMHCYEGRRYGFNYQLPTADGRWLIIESLSNFLRTIEDTMQGYFADAMAGNE